METSTLATGEITPAKIYRDLNAEELIASLIAGSNSSTARHEEQLIPVIEVYNPNEVGDAGVQVYHPSSNYFEQYPTDYNEDNIHDEVDGKAGDQVVQTDLATNDPGTPSNATGRRRGCPPGPVTPRNATGRRRGRPPGPVTPSNATGRRSGRPPGPVKRYICPHCNAENRYLSLHEQHMVRHETAELSCPTCAKVLKRKSDLVRHMKVHAESWKCNRATDGPCGDDGCGMVFSRKDAMARHWAKVKKMKVHAELWKCNGATDGPCGDDGCGMVFSRKDAMARHCARVKEMKEKSG